MRCIKDSSDLEMFSDFLDLVENATKESDTLFPMLVSVTNKSDKISVMFDALTHPTDMEIIMTCETPTGSFDEMVGNIVSDMREQVRYVSKNNEQIAEEWSSESGADIEDCIDNNYKFVDIYSNLADYIENELQQLSLF